MASKKGNHRTASPSEPRDLNAPTASEPRGGFEAVEHNGFNQETTVKTVNGGKIVVTTWTN